MEQTKNEELSKKKEKCTADLLSLLYIPLVFVYNEIILKAFAGQPVFEDWGFRLLFSLTSGFILSGLIAFAPPKAQKICTMVLLYITALLFAAQCLIRNSFQLYMEFDSIFAGLGGVVTGYFENITNSVLNSIPQLLLFFAPAVLYTVLGRKLHFVPQNKLSPALSAGTAVLAAGIFCVTAAGASSGEYGDIYKTRFDFDLATEKFGLCASLRLSTQYALFGNEEEILFVMEDIPETSPVTLGSSSSDTAGAATVTAVPEETSVTAQTSVPMTETASSAESETGETEPSATEGVTSEPSQTVTEKTTAAPLPVVGGVNAMAIDFAGIPNPSAKVTALNQYVQSLAPSNKNAYTGLFKGKNLILICAEAFSDVVIDEKMTPTLYRLSHKGIYFSEYYQPTWGGSTSTGEYSFLTGLVPTHGVDSMYTIRNNNNYFTMGNQLQRLGYTSCAYHNGTFDFYNRDKTHKNLGYDNYLAFGNGLENIIRRYSDDSVMFDATLDEYIDKQPFSLYYMTISGHCIYNAENNKVKQNLSKVLETHGNKYKDKTNYYLCYQLELENALTLLVQKLEEAGIADDTVICITSDHYPYGLEQSNTYKNDRDYVTDLYGYKYSAPWEKDHNTWILWSGCLENELSDYACEISSPTYSLDILPTLSNLFGLEYDSRLLVGRDVFSGQEAIAVWNSYSWATERGKYNARTRKFYPNEGYEYDKAYVDRISGLVKNKINFSGQVVDNNYYQVLFGADENT
ncbi:MAG: sulfatase-like hydrolase/transferase [Huintestinicola sp.]|uniref:sulfatase-like hydrolase/transferase n=1 Tax=Huintestinicola sp. TaxID=2981661 RepID=UPI003F0DDCC8